MPEEFLGAALPVGTRKTDASGYATISQPSRDNGEPSRGMCPGFYRVEITKGGEIPAKYNTATVLGQEVAVDAGGISTGGILFELSY